MANKLSPADLGSLMVDIPKRSTATFSILYKEIEKIQGLLKTDKKFTPFKDLSSSLALFLAGEKTRLNRVSETRLATSSEGEVLTGFAHDYSPQPFPFDASFLEPFRVRALWIPYEEGDLYYENLDDTRELSRKIEGSTRFLFLVHPLSENLYRPLLQKYSDTQQFLPAIALSSLRSLLVALPILGGYKHLIAKVSLDLTCSGALRHLTKKECFVSVANSIFLERAAFRILKEQVAFVPSRHLLNPSIEKAQKLGAGMIYRFLPENFITMSSKELLLPLFSILGEHNKDLLKALIADSHLNPEDFICQSLLHPLAQKVAYSIFVENTSFELHGQNLLLALKEQESVLEIDFVYRDLGGVNRLPQPCDPHLLSAPLLVESLSWAHNHQEDTAKALEAFVQKVLFNITKMFFNDEELTQRSSNFSVWKEEMVQRKLAVNWQIIDQEGHHQTRIELPLFCRYGFFEKTFGKMLAREISLHIQKKDVEALVTFTEDLQPPEELFSLCHAQVWFEELIKRFYTPN